MSIRYATVRAGGLRRRRWRLVTRHSYLNSHHIQLIPDEGPYQKHVLIKQIRPRLNIDEYLNKRPVDVCREDKDPNATTQLEICNVLSLF